MLVMFLRFPEEGMTGIVLVTWTYRTPPGRAVCVKQRHLALFLHVLNVQKVSGEGLAVIETSVYV